MWRDQSSEIIGSIVVLIMGILFHFLNNMPERPQVSQPSESRLSFPKFGFSGFCLLIGLVTFAIQQGCSVTGNAPSWIWGCVWFSLAIVLILLAIWFWDQTASHHWIRKSLFSLGVTMTMGTLSYFPVATQYRAEHAKAVPTGQTMRMPTAEEIADELAKKVPRLRDEQRPTAQPARKESIQTNRIGTKNATSGPSSTDWLSSLKTPPTMIDVFINDFPHTMRLHDEGEFHWKDISTVTHLKRQLYLDFPANSKFVGFYIPTTDPTDLSRTAEICLKLAQIDAVQQVLTELPKKTFIAASLGQTTTIQDLTFSGRVVIYHDDFLSTTQQADIIRAFSEQHYSVGFFGPNEFGKTLISWHHLHDAKAAD
jgi:hypothetical protein